MQQIPILEGIQIKTLMFFILELSCPSSVIIRKANITKIKKQATRDDEPGQVHELENFRPYVRTSMDGVE
jgi:hypothetical protein